MNLDKLLQYIDVLRLSGWQTFMLACGAIIFLYLSKNEYIPALDPPWVELIVWAVLLVCAALAAASLAQAFQRAAAHVLKLFQRRRSLAKARQSFIDDIPFLTDKERQILSYLREKKQKRFNAHADAGYGSTLLAKGYIVIISARGGQHVDMTDVPMAVADYVWTVMEERPQDFPYKPEFSSRYRSQEVQPWWKPVV